MQSPAQRRQHGRPSGSSFAALLMLACSPSSATYVEAPRIEQSEVTVERILNQATPDEGNRPTVAARCLRSDGYV
jgi:hypothetical protein